MKTSKKQTKPESRKRNYTKPEIKKREQIKEVTEGGAPVVSHPV
jgi:16S rRNA C1402 (ribose-2'-O) methylase RsmI